MPRVCGLSGCGTPLLKKNGESDFRRHWCSPEHKNLDKKEAMQARRASVHGRKCRTCGRRPPKAGVSREHGQGRSLQADLNKLHQQDLRLRSERQEEPIENNNL